MEEARATPGRCYLIELPTELRLRIYEFVFNKPLRVSIDWCSESWWLREKPEEPEGYDFRPPPRNVSSLLKTCRLINREASPVRFGTVWFSFYLGLIGLIDWYSGILADMGAFHHLLEHLEVRINLTGNYKQIASDVRHLSSLLASDHGVTIRAACATQLSDDEPEDAVEEMSEAFDEEISGCCMAVEAVAMYRSIQEQILLEL